MQARFAIESTGVQHGKTWQRRTDRHAICHQQKAARPRPQMRASHLTFRS